MAKKCNVVVVIEDGVGGWFGLHNGAAGSWLRLPYYLSSLGFLYINTVALSHSPEDTIYLRYYFNNICGM